MRYVCLGFVFLIPAVLAVPNPHAHHHRQGWANTNVGPGASGISGTGWFPTGLSPTGWFPTGWSPTGLSPTGWFPSSSTSAQAINETPSTSAQAVNETPSTSVQAANETPSTSVQVVNETPSTAPNPTTSAVWAASSAVTQNSEAAVCSPTTVTVTVDYTDTVTVTPSQEAGAFGSQSPPLTGWSTLAAWTTSGSLDQTPSSANGVAIASSVSADESPDTCPAATAESAASTAIPPSAIPSSSVEPILASSPSAIPSSSVEPIPASSPPPSGATPIPTTNGSNTTSSSGSKRGLLVQIGSSGGDPSVAEEASLINAVDQSSQISWTIDWYSAPPGTSNPTSSLSSKVEFVPQMYGKTSDDDGTWTKNAGKAIAAGETFFLSYGEPETVNAQLYMDPQTAAQEWMVQLQPWTEKGATVGAPATLQGYSDQLWLQQFLQLCTGCNIGFVAMHWMSSNSDVQGFQDVVNNYTAIANSIGKPLWIDNFQAGTTQAEQLTFLQTVVPWIESQPVIERYAYVPWTATSGNGFLNPDLSQSALGDWYLNTA